MMHQPMTPRGRIVPTVACQAGEFARGRPSLALGARDDFTDTGTRREIHDTAEEDLRLRLAAFKNDQGDVGSEAR